MTPDQNACFNHDSNHSVNKEQYFKCNNLIQISKKLFDCPMSSPIIIHGDKKSTLVTQNTEVITRVNGVNIQLKHVNLFLLPFVNK